MKHGLLFCIGLTILLSLGMVGCGDDGTPQSEIAQQLCKPYICEYLKQCQFETEDCLQECPKSTDAQIQQVAACLNNLGGSCDPNWVNSCLP